jgi:platelet-activating factor acetylhydrolase
MEIEVPVENPHTISHITRDGRHLFQLETVLFTLFYPAAFGSGSGKAPGGQKRWSRETWLPRPRMETAKGYSKFGGIPDWAGIGFFGVTSMLTKLRAYRNTPPARHWPPSGNSKKDGRNIKNEEGPPPEGMNREPIFPLLMFSHGLGGSRTAYSTLCTEFASYGFVVCAVEHRDGSGPRTFVNHPKTAQSRQRGNSGNDINTVQETPTTVTGDEKAPKNLLDHTQEELNQGFHYLVNVSSTKHGSWN